MQPWRVAESPKDDKYQYTYFGHKVNNSDTAPRKLSVSDSRLCPDRLALEHGDLSKAGYEKTRLEERQREEKRKRESNHGEFELRWFDWTGEVAPTPWGDLEVYQYNGKHDSQRCDHCSDKIDLEVMEFNSWQYQD